MDNFTSVRANDYAAEQYALFVGNELHEAVAVIGSVAAGNNRERGESNLDIEALFAAIIFTRTNAGNFGAGKHDIRSGGIVWYYSSSGG